MTAQGAASLQAVESTAAAILDAQRRIDDLQWEWGRVADAMQWHSPAWAEAQQLLDRIGLRIMLARLQTERCLAELDSARAFYTAIS